MALTSDADDEKAARTAHQRASVVHKSLGLRRHHSDALRAADAVLLWILYGRQFGPTAVPFLAKDAGILLDWPGVVPYDIVGDMRTSFLELALQAAPSTLADKVAKWVEQQFPSELPEGVHAALETLGVRYALLIHTWSGLRLVHAPRKSDGVALFTTLPRVKGDLIPFLSAQISVDAAGGVHAAEWDPARPRSAQALTWLVGPLRLVSAGCTPNCKLELDEGLRPLSAMLRVTCAIPPGAQLALHDVPQFFGERLNKLICVHPVRCTP
ncbi:hypothetical protein EXIGLDRAFT_766862 [Exidia glandulosa HHB12029]|uniref:Uncharacterized protein n=1 Tax=Exidia glandulosa HHB12029 TaxID=1314781 RepID=A0A165JDS2_EXIGL|nr:hypothetical protein EXIGLDRAFT_766862 [Exidia glandulosa HHB12029]